MDTLSEVFKAIASYPWQVNVGVLSLIPLYIIDFKFYFKLDIENPIIRINTAFKGCSSLEKISVLPRIYHN